MTIEEPFAIQEYPIPGLSQTDADKLEALQGPARFGGNLHHVIGPELWYRRVYKGSFDPESLEWKTFCREYQAHVQANPSLADPYTYIDKNWQAKPVATHPQVRPLLIELADRLNRSSGRMEVLADNPQDYRMVHYLQKVAELTRTGQWDEVCKAWIAQAEGATFTLAVVPMETRDDRLARGASVQGLLTVTDREMTQQARDQSLALRNVAEDLYSDPLPKAIIIAARANIISGNIGQEGYRSSGFNIPNDPKVIKEAGGNLIYLLTPSMSRKHEQTLGPKARDFGISTSAKDIFRYAVTHEISHGYRYPGEDTRWGVYRTAARELWADNRGLVLAANAKTNELPRGYIQSVIQGSLAFAIDDAGRFVETLLTGSDDRPTLSQLLAEVGGYGVGGYIILKQGLESGAIGHIGRKGLRLINPDKLIRLAHARDEVLDGLAHTGQPDDIEKYLTELIEGSVYKGSSFDSGKGSPKDSNPNIVWAYP